MKPAFLLAALLFACLAWTDDLKASACTGKWILNGCTKAVRFELKPNGTFEYKGYGSESTGRWNVEGARIRLRWTLVDSVKVDSQKVTGLFDVEAGTLKVGKFEYRKG